MTTTFYSVFYTFPTILGAGATRENMNDPSYSLEKELNSSKNWIFFSLISEFTSYILVPILKMNNSPRACLLKGVAIYTLSPLLVTVGYMTNNLTVVRLSNITHGLGVGMMFGGYNPYYVQILNPQLTGIPNFGLSFMNSIFTMLYPLIFKEGVPKKTYVYGFALMSISIMISWIWLYFNVHETKGLSNAQIEAKFRNIEKNKKSKAKKSTSQKSNKSASIGGQVAIKTPGVGSTAIEIVNDKL